MTAEPAGGQPLPASRPGTPRARIDSTEPQIFGMFSPLAGFVIGLGGFALGVVLIASGSGLPAALVLLAALFLVSLAVHAARRWPGSSLGRLGTHVADGLGVRLGIARATDGVWSDVSRERIEAERELRALREERRERQAELGEAAYREEAGKVERLRRRLTEIDDRIEGRRREAGDVGEDAHERIERERVAAQPTQPFAVAEAPPPVSAATSRRPPESCRRDIPPDRRRTPRTAAPSAIPALRPAGSGLVLRAQLLEAE
jgi:hypothetical protein